MGDIPDETLMAYADGELEPAERASVEAVLSVEPEARRRLEAFAGTREQLARVFDQDIREPMPERFRDLIARRAQARSASWVARVSNQLAPLKHVLLPPLVGSPAALTLVLLLGIWIGWALSRVTARTESAGSSFVDLPSGGIVAAGPFSRALDDTPSGRLASWQGGGVATVSFKPAFSFLSRDQAYCRQYEMSDAGGSGFAGLACRSGDGTWRIELHMRAPVGGTASGKIVPAGRGSTPLDAVVDRLIAGDVLVGPEEEETIRSGWRVKP